MSFNIQHHLLSIIRILGTSNLDRTLTELVGQVDDKLVVEIVPVDNPFWWNLPIL